MMRRLEEGREQERTVALLAARGMKLAMVWAEGR
jgi:hypothetical protein